jgi:hypothetical protein
LIFSSANEKRRNRFLKKLKRSPAYLKGFADASLYPDGNFSISGGGIEESKYAMFELCFAVGAL